MDADTTGIIILTNDSELSNILTHPKYELPKTYVVGIKGHIVGEKIEKLKKGIDEQKNHGGAGANNVNAGGPTQNMIDEMSEEISDDDIESVLNSPALDEEESQLQAYY